MKKYHENLLVLINFENWVCYIFGVIFNHALPEWGKKEMEDWKFDYLPVISDPLNSEETGKSYDSRNTLSLNFF